MPNNDSKTRTMALTFAQAQTPKRGVDYWTEADKNAVVQEATPKRGVDYWTEADKNAVVQEATPKRGVDYWTEADKSSIVQELTPADPIPAYWSTYLDERIHDIQAHQAEGGADSFSFVLIGDIHYNENLGKRSPLLARRIMDACSIKYALVPGDFQSRGSWSSKEQAQDEWDGIRTMCEPLSGRMLAQRGNHDGAWGASLNGVTYPFNFTSGELDSLVYRPARMLDHAELDASGTTYYVDHKADKVRYLMLNATCNPDEVSENGAAAHNSMTTFRFTQPQFDFVKEACLSMTEGWSLVVVCHVPISNAYGSLFNGTNLTDAPNDRSAGDHTIMRSLLMAYRNKTSYSGGWNGTADYDAVSINADFTDAKGEFIAFFASHSHNDFFYPRNDYGIDIITTRCDGACENLGTLLSERVSGTITEQCFDVFTINRKTGYVHATRIGAGADRGFAYRDVRTHAISYDLSYVTCSNTATSVVSGSSFQTTLTAVDGYMPDTVQITMGGKDITETVYSGNTVYIAKVTDDVEIQAHATVIPPDWTNALPTALAAVGSSDIYNGKGYKNGVYPSGESGAITEGIDSSIVYSGYIPFSVPLKNPENAQVLYMKGVTFNSSNSHHRIVTWSAGSSANNPYLEGSSIWPRYFTLEELGPSYYKLTPIHDAYTSARGGVTHIRIAATGIGENWIISVNNPIE